MTDDTVEKRYLSIAEFCERYSIGATSARSLVRQNKIEAVKLGVRTLVCVRSADAYFASLPRLSAS